MVGRVLLVDDDANILRAYVRVLDDPSFKLHTMQSAHQVLAHLEVEGADVIIADQFMAEMTGIQLFDVLRKRHPDVVRVLITGHPQLNVAVEAVNSGEIFRFLTKPCSSNEIAQTIHQALRYQREVAQGLRLVRLLDAAVDAMDSSLA